MGAPLLFPTAGAPLSDKERTHAVRSALQDGTVQRVADLMNWSPHDLAGRIHVVPHLVAAWLDGTQEPSPHACGKLWDVLVNALRSEPSPTPDPVPATLAARIPPHGAPLA